MTSTKPWYASKGILGGVVSAVSGILGIYLGAEELIYWFSLQQIFDVPNILQEQMVSIILFLVAAVGGLVSVCGYAVAKDKIS